MLHNPRWKIYAVKINLTERDLGLNFFTTSPDEVFTPRSAEVSSLYIPRPELELELQEALSETQHIVIFGESGNGKSWLYKKEFEKEMVYYEVINLVQASRLGSLNDAFLDKVDRLEERREQGYDIETGAKFAPGHVGVERSKKWSYSIGKKEPYEDLLSYMQATSKNNEC